MALTLDSSRWKELQDAYGSAEVAPTLLQRLATKEDPETRKETWDDLWSRICHQGNIYEASDAAIPHLVNLAPMLPKEDQPMCWFLIASIMVDNYSKRVPKDLVEDFCAAENEIERLILEALQIPDRDPKDVLTLMQSLALFMRNHWHASILRGLKWGETHAECPKCDKELRVDVNTWPFTAVVADSKAGQNPRETTAVRPSTSPQDDNAEWPQTLELDADICRKAGQPELAERLEQLNCDILCPNCDERFHMPSHVCP